MTDETGYLCATRGCDCPPEVPCAWRDRDDPDGEVDDTAEAVHDNAVSARGVDGVPFTEAQQAGDAAAGMNSNVNDCEARMEPKGTPLALRATQLAAVRDAGIVITDDECVMDFVAVADAHHHALFGELATLLTARESMGRTPYRVVIRSGDAAHPRALALVAEKAPAFVDQPRTNTVAWALAETAREKARIEIVGDASLTDDQKDDALGWLAAPCPRCRRAVRDDDVTAEHVHGRIMHRACYEAVMDELSGEANARAADDAEAEYVDVVAPGGDGEPPVVETPARRRRRTRTRRVA